MRLKIGGTPGAEQAREGLERATCRRVRAAISIFIWPTFHILLLQELEVESVGEVPWVRGAVAP